MGFMRKRYSWAKLTNSVVTALSIAQKLKWTTHCVRHMESTVQWEVADEQRSCNVCVLF